MKKLSTRIKERMKHCGVCHGSISYKKAGYSFFVACPECTDWKVVLKGILELEKMGKEIKALKRQIKLLKK